MSNQNSQEQLVSLTMTELAKVLQDLKEGKTPEMSSSMKKIASELHTVNERKQNMSEDEVKGFAERLIKEISKLED